MSSFVGNHRKSVKKTIKKHETVDKSFRDILKNHWFLIRGLQIYCVLHQAPAENLGFPMVFQSTPTSGSTCFPLTTINNFHQPHVFENPQNYLAIQLLLQPGMVTVFATWTRTAAWPLWITPSDAVALNFALDFVAQNPYDFIEFQHDVQNPYEVIGFGDAQNP